MNRSYRLLGIGFIVAGATLGPLSYFVLDSTVLTAACMSGLIIGFTAVGLANTRPDISPEACQMLLETGMQNTSALLEELGLRNRAVYLPSSLRNGHPQAIVPLNEREGFAVRGTIAGRMIVRYGAHPDDMGIAVTTPGSLNLAMLEERPGGTPDELQTAISHIAVGMLDLASSVSVDMSGSDLTIDFRNPKLHWQDIWYYRALGSPLASIAASVACEGLDKPTRVKEESYQKGVARVNLEVLD